MTFVPGNKYFYYSESIGVIELTYHMSASAHDYFIKDNGEYAEFAKGSDVVFETEDLALINHFRKKEVTARNNIFHHREKIKHYVHILKKIERNLEELKEEYPEEFI